MPLLQALVEGGCLSFLYMLFTGEGGDLRELPGGGGEFSHRCGRVFFSLSHRCFFSCKKTDNNKNNHFTTCRCAMPCCAVLWCVSVGPRRSEAGKKPPQSIS